METMICCTQPELAHENGEVILLSDDDDDEDNSDLQIVSNDLFFTNYIEQSNKIPSKLDILKEAKIKLYHK